MNDLSKGAVFCATCLLSLSAYAQSTTPLTREQVRQDTIALQIAGYNPSTSNSTDYPENVQSAQRRLAAMQADGTFDSVAAASRVTGAGRNFYPRVNSQ
ncbi:DUF4148 domain-containing protein [Paraburkholderia humisilvae]|uniref:DUF4148 domain-containing protein n=1 Tax=Paraburkholderia humisilvae TaxID=627669 RepID=A0A6J5EHE0_9BURK|nr:DUF4148 domain-containing protein [Paraburkholderia humisilvae]CAB3764475.1 hypothetical protein LMG29542_04904 [Paraburkholderia humisilvae]